MPGSSASSSGSWRRLLRLIALAVACGVLAYWVALGAHRGWSQHRVPIQKTDEITGIEFIDYEDRFRPGIDVVGGGLLFATFLAGVSFWPKSRSLAA